MKRVTSEQVEAARQIDLLTYFEKYYPDDLVRVSAREYCTSEHDSLRMSHSGWMWWSRRIDGKSALDYLIKVEGYSFVDAVEKIVTGFTQMEIERKQYEPQYLERELELPEKNGDNKRLFAYLRSRGIDKEVINYCIDKELIFESLPYHNVVFVGYDQTRMPKYASYRAACQKRIMGECPGSNKEYSFRISEGNNNTVHIFESAIDLLSFATIEKLKGNNWKDNNMLSLGGVYVPSENSGINKSFHNYIHSMDKDRIVKNIVLHFDNDETGRNATRGFIDQLGGIFSISDEPARCGKDFNDYLMMEFVNDKER